MDDGLDFVGALGGTVSDEGRALEVQRMAALQVAGRAAAHNGEGDLVGSVTADETERLIADVRDYIARFIHATPEQTLVCAVWVLHTWVIAAARSTPYLQIVSPEPDSGKTTLAEVIEKVAREALSSIDPTDAVIYRVIEQREPTLILDEIDIVLPSGSGDARGPQRAILGLLNAGYRRGKVVHRMGGKGYTELQEFNLFCPKILVGIDKGLRPTLASRCIRLEMEPATDEEMAGLEEFIPDEVEEDTTALSERLAAWAERAIPAIKVATRPERIPGLKRRQVETAKILLHISAQAGDRFDGEFRDALEGLSTGQGTSDATTSSGRALLADTRDVFDALGESQVSTTWLLKALFEIEVSPWAGWWAVTDEMTGKLVAQPGAAKKLGNMLNRYGIRSRDIWIPRANKSLKGYLKADFQNAFARYLAETRVSTRETRENAVSMPFPGDSYPRGNENPRGSGSPANPHEQRDLAGLADRNHALAAETPESAPDDDLDALLTEYRDDGTG